MVKIWVKEKEKRKKEKEKKEKWLKGWEKKKGKGKDFGEEEKVSLVKQKTGMDELDGGKRGKKEGKKWEMEGGVVRGEVGNKDRELRGEGREGDYRESTGRCKWRGGDNEVTVAVDAKPVMVLVDDVALMNGK